MIDLLIVCNTAKLSERCLTVYMDSNKATTVYKYMFFFICADCKVQMLVMWCFLLHKKTSRLKVHCGAQGHFSIETAD